MKSRARDLERNSDITQAILSAFVRNVIGKGIHPQPKILDANGEDFEELNDEIEKHWKYWTRAKNCDIQGQLSFHEMLKVIFVRKFVDGDIFILKKIDSTAKIPFKIQLVENDNLDTSVNFEKNGVICIQGIEFDENLKPVAYHFKKSLDYFSFESERIPANQVIHLFKKNRPSQIMGISEMVGEIDRIKNVDEFLEAEMVAQRVAACFSLFVESENEERRANFKRNIDDSEEDEDGRIDTIAPGIIEYLKPGEKISAANPGRNSTNAKDFVEMQLRLIGAGLGLSYESLSRSMSQVTFSSARQSMLEDRKTFEQHQQYLIEYFLREVYTEFVISCVNEKILKIDDFWENKDRYLSNNFVTSGWTWIDPKKEIDAITIELKNGMTTLAHVAASHGKDWKEILVQRAKEQKFAEKIGVRLDIDSTDIQNPDVIGGSEEIGTDAEED